MVLLVLFDALPVLVRPFPPVSVDVVDAMRGALLGATLAVDFLLCRSRRLEQVGT